MSDFAVAVQGIENLGSIAELAPKARLAAMRAVNKAVDRTRTQSSRMIRDRKAFPASYLQEPGRLGSQKAKSPASPTAYIIARQRGTSLNRFARRSGKYLAVRINVGSQAKTLKRAFVMNLRSGNVGVAMRLRPGENPGNRLKKDVWTNSRGQRIWFMYGPSVDQVFRQVAEDVSPFAADVMQAEFQRLLALDMKGGR